MHEWLIATVIQPTLLAMCELCEKHGISCVFYVERKHAMTDDFLTHSIQGDCTTQMKNTLAAAEGKIK